MSDLLAHLNPPQRAAVTLPAQHALILAGAGSGKTRVLTTRIAWLIANGQVGPHGILAVTFTNKAAKEMQLRLAAMLPINPRGMWIGTFHGLCNRLLRAHHQEAGLPAQFQILDAADQLSAIKRLLKNQGVDEERYPARELMHFINAHKEQGIRAAQAEAYDQYTSRRVELYAAYEAQCQREGVVDFAELLLRADELLRRNEPLCRHYQARFRHILVDEFQDTNRLQYEWLKLLAGHGSVAPEGAGACLFAVGDDDQSIYAFRGAEIGNMRDLQREFQLAEVIRLEQNYRSHGNILDAANALIQQNRSRLGKKLWTEAGAGEVIRVFTGWSDVDEARFIVAEIAALVGSGIARDQIALLYRSNAQSRVLEHELYTRGVAYRVHGGLRFFDRQEIRHALAYLRLIANPDDDTAFARVVNFPPRGIGSRSLEVLAEAARQAGSSLYRAAAGLPGKAGSSAAKFTALLDHLRAQAQGRSLAEIVELAIEHSGLRQHYLNDREGRERLANLDELLNATIVFLADQGDDGEASNDGQPVAGADPLTAFLAHASLEAGEHQAGDGQEAVQLMTVHAAKGLEFDAVFITGLEQGLFPHENAARAGEGIEEERRLMYVAVTRARRQLYLTYAQQRMLHGQTRECLPSLFLDELPAELLRRIERPSVGSGRLSTARVGSPAWPQARMIGGLRVGRSVHHARFGSGVVVALEGSGSDGRAQVNFAEHGMKWLHLATAKLTAT